MKIKEGFVLREIAGQAVVIATGPASKEFRGMIKLNSTGKLIWQGLMDGLSEEEISQKIVDTYEVDRDRAEADVKQMLNKMKEHGFLIL